ncbi:RnfH family protein [Candidatus Erwinia haradaeae]
MLVDVVYALPYKQYLIHVELATGSTVKQAIITSDILYLRPELNLIKNKVGIFGTFVTLDDTVYHGDRIEIYRPIVAKPKDLLQRREYKGIKNVK